MGLVDLYIKTGKPVGSAALQESGFEQISSATLRNYFTILEKEGYLKQLHASGGRVPTTSAFRLYAEEALEEMGSEVEEGLEELSQEATKGLSSYLYLAAEIISQASGYATFLSSVRFDHDFVLDIKFISIDHSRVLGVILTDFGQILTEVIPVDEKFSSFKLRRLESYFEWKLKGAHKTAPSLSKEEEVLFQRIYSEIMVRYLVRYSNFSDADIIRTGFSRLLAHPEFSDPLSLTTALSLFENGDKMRLLLNDCIGLGKLQFWIGPELAPYALTSQNCTVIAMPYTINHTPAGAIGILGPCRLPYRTLIALLHTASNHISKTLTKSLSKFKLSFRHPRSGTVYLEKNEWMMGTKPLLEAKEKRNG